MLQRLLSASPVRLFSSVTASHCEGSTESAMTENSGTPEAEYKRLVQRISAKERKLENLRMVESYEQKNECSGTQEKLQKWRKALQQALIALRCEHPEPKPPMAEFIKTAGISPDMLDFDEDADVFKH